MFFTLTRAVSSDVLSSHNYPFTGERTRISHFSNDAKQGFSNDAQQGAPRKLFSSVIEIGIKNMSVILYAGTIWHFKLRQIPKICPSLLIWQSWLTGGLWLSNQIRRSLWVKSNVELALYYYYTVDCWNRDDQNPDGHQFEFQTDLDVYKPNARIQTQVHPIICYSPPVYALWESGFRTLVVV